MGKPKKGKKGQADDFSDEEVVIDPLAEMEHKETNPAPVAKATKKGKKNRKRDDDFEDDVASEIAALSLDMKSEENGEDAQPAKKKEKKKKKKKAVDSDDEEDDEEDAAVKTAVKTKGKKPMASFQMLMMDDDDDDEDEDKSDNESTQEMKTENVVLESVVESTTKSKKDKKAKKKEKAKTTEEEDIDAILAALEKPAEKKKGKKGKKAEEDSVALETDQNEAAPAAAEGQVVTMDDLEGEYEDKKKKKKKKEKKVEKAEDDEDEKVEEEDEEEGSTVKSAAQKKKEKKERERLKKLQKKKSVPKDGEKEEQKEGEAEAEKIEEETEAAADGAGEEEEGTKKKKKKKKGEKEKEEKAKPNKKVAAIKAHLKMIQEEQEKLRQEEEERIRLEEEAEKAHEEQLRLEKEKREKKKLKEKEKKDRLKAEGKLLNAKQKRDQQKINQMLLAMREQGLEIPDKDATQKKRPFYGDKRKKKDHQKEQTPSPSEEKTPVIENVPEKAAVEETGKEEPATEVKDSWEDADKDVKDAWDLSDEEPELEKTANESKTGETTTESAKPSTSRKDESDEEEEESEEESDEESDEDSDEETESSEESSDEEDMTPIERGREKIEKWTRECAKKRTTDVLRAPVVCVLGHVDTGKTKILDKLRRTHVQDGEAGGITQQIGATNVPVEAIMDQTKMCKEFQKQELKVPGLLIIDTPGHESFSNLRSRGSSLCDIAILVVDIMHGLEPQTIESINLLKEKDTPFIIALNKIDRLYQWKAGAGSDVHNVLKKQTTHTRSEFDERMNQVIVQMAEQGLNTTLFFNNKDPSEYISMVPTSAHSGDGMGNLIALICEMSQTVLAERVSYSEALHATVMEVKALPGLGTTIDVILVDGKINEGASVVLAGTDGPIVTQIRGLLMPQPMKELRVKNQYEHHKEVKAAQGVKIIAKDLEKALAGLPLYVARDKDEEEYYKSEVAKALKDVLESIKLSERGVFVQASTLGSLEALLEFLKTSKIPYAGINIGPVHKKDIMKASIMLEHDSQYAVILAFDVKVEREAQDMADNLGVKIFMADIIYHLFDRFMEFRAELKRKKQEEFKHIAVFPCKLRVLPQFIFNSRDPIVLGVSIENGFIKEGTPVCVPSKEFVDLGRITSIENNHKNVDMARQGQEVCIKIESLPGDTPKMYGRHFDHTDILVSKISRESIDAVKDYFRDDMQKQDWMLIVELKKQFAII
ncbi:eukaryotic translation initiation factor 5B-like isoform X2 [Haliotis cracherodii]|uniref:eukaryotic translation initiation factor 5B-like isoform X2 n=1 Tax=Haliotis cracherodii TaxID=6455 RepID=UPI0039ED194E